MIDTNPVTLAAGTLTTSCIAVLTLFGADALDQPPGTWLGLAAVALTGVFGIITLQINSKNNIREARLQMRLDQVEKSEAECKASQLTMQTELNALRVTKPSAVTGFYVFAGLDEKIIDVTDGVRDVLGYRPAELIGENIDVLIPPSIQPAHHAGIRKARETGIMRPANLAIKTQARHKNGQALDVIVSLDADTKKNVACQRAEIMLRGGIIE